MTNLKAKRAEAGLPRKSRLAILLALAAGAVSGGCFGYPTYPGATFDDPITGDSGGEVPSWPSSLSSPHFSGSPPI